ncbi:MAG: peptidylprolyl isomerase, partial [Acidimicrobiales bacterium]
RTLATQWLAGLAAVEPGADELDAYVAANVDELTAKAVCSSHILVDTSDEAEAVAERLAAGESFADVAREVSIDTGSGAAGGDLGCVALGTFVPEYETAALQAELGVVTEPVQSEFGFHLILTREATADELLPIASATINEQTQATMDTAIEEATVVLAPQFGTWDAAAHLYSPPPA